MSAQIISQREWSTSTFTGVQIVIEAADEQEAEEAARPAGMVADVVAVAPGRFEVMVLSD